MNDEITHQYDPDTGHIRQIVSPQRLREILDASDDNYDRPKDFRPNDEWNVKD